MTLTSLLAVTETLRTGGRAISAAIKKQPGLCKAVPRSAHAEWVAPKDRRDPVQILIDQSFLRGADFACAYADQTKWDWRAFCSAIGQGRIVAS